MNTEILKDYGIDYQKGLSRCMDDVDLYEMILTLFLKDDTFNRAETYLASHDYKGVFSCMHELKGASGNAELTDLYKDTCVLVELLRSDTLDTEHIDSLYKTVFSKYVKAKQGIELANKT